MKPSAPGFVPFRRLRRPASGYAATAVALLLAAACGGDPAGPGAVERITELPRPLSAVERELVGASNTFAFELGRELLPASGTENLFYSPLSASMLLGMLLNGADGETYAQMRAMLGFDGLGQEQINQGYRDLTDLLLALDPAVTVEIGNSVWTQLGFPVLPDFMERVRSSFDAEAADVSFADPATLERINGWANDATRGRIETIFDELPGNVVMVLLNAIYFKADWTARFDRERTQAAPFTRGDGSQVSADLMYLETEVATHRGDGATYVELPYGGEAFSMVVALPDPGMSVNALAEQLTAQKWEAAMDALEKGPAVVRLPRFELEWEKELNDPLQRLGMTDAFDGRADFRRLTPGGGVWLDLVKQKSFVKVDEEGTEAAAVSGAVVVRSAPQEIRVDRPFLFVLRERLTGTVLFLGVINDPTA